MTLPCTLELTPLLPDFPVAVRAMVRPPETLYVKGQLPHGPGVAIVGTRGANEPAIEYTERLASFLTRHGIVVWSGGAAGIDAAAHRGALDAGGHTVVVMGTGFDQTYPAEHRGLFEQVLERGGAWLGMLPPSHPGTKWSFLLRNELLAALVEAVVMVQAPLRSGARSTLAAARRMGRRIWVVPAAPWDPLGAGCADELLRGAEPMPRASDLASVLLGRRMEGAGAGRPVDPPSDLGPADRAVYEAVASGSGHLDEICGKTGLPARQVSQALLTLSMRHVLVQGSDGRIRTAN